MDRVPVDSEAIRSVGYEDGVLEIAFSSGSTYLYFDVPQGVHEELMRADSHGRFFSRQIRDRFRYARVNESGAEDAPAAAIFAPKNGVASSPSRDREISRT